MNKFGYLFLFVSLLGLVFLFNGINKPQDDLQLEYDDQEPSIASYSNNILENGLEEEAGVEELAHLEEADNSVSYKCINACGEALNALTLDGHLDDEALHALLKNVDKLALYLIESPVARSDLFELALSTSDVNKRALILAAFARLSDEDRDGLGFALIDSAHPDRRRAGVEFLASPDTMDRPMAIQFSEMAAIERDEHIKTLMIKALNQPEKFRGDEEIIETLDYFVRSEIDAGVRGESLLTMVELASGLDQAADQTFSAIRSDDNAYQLYGLRALDAMLTRKSTEGLEMSWMNEQSSTDIFDELLEPRYEKSSPGVHKAADLVYERHFL